MNIIFYNLSKREYEDRYDKKKRIYQKRLVTIIIIYTPTHKSILYLRVHCIRHDVISRRENVVCEYIGNPIQLMYNIIERCILKSLSFDFGPFNFNIKIIQTVIT